MIRVLLAYFFAWLATKLAGVTPPAPVLAPPPVATLVPDGRERYVHELVSLKHAKCDGVLAYVLGSPVWFDGYSFTKVADVTWRQ